jgi:hypothetical protein
VGGQRHTAIAVPSGKTLSSVVQDAVSAAGLVWTGAENVGSHAEGRRCAHSPFQPLLYSTSQRVPKIKQSDHHSAGVRNDCTSTSTPPCLFMTARCFST